MYRKCKKITHVINITRELKHERNYMNEGILTGFRSFSRNSQVNITPCQLD